MLCTAMPRGVDMAIWNQWIAGVALSGHCPALFIGVIPEFTPEKEKRETKMSKNDEKHDSELPMDELEQVAGGTATPPALTSSPSANSTPFPPTGPVTPPKPPPSDPPWLWSLKTGK
jgi:hypothetical protein